MALPLLYFPLLFKWNQCSINFLSLIDETDNKDVKHNMYCTFMHSQLDAVHSIADATLLIDYQTLFIIACRH